MAFTSHRGDCQLTHKPRPLEWRWGGPAVVWGIGYPRIDKDCRADTYNATRQLAAVAGSLNKGANRSGLKPAARNGADFTITEKSGRAVQYALLELGLRAVRTWALWGDSEPLASRLGIFSRLPRPLPQRRRRSDCFLRFRAFFFSPPASVPRFRGSAILSDVDQATPSMWALGFGAVRFFAMRRLGRNRANSASSFPKRHS